MKIAIHNNPGRKLFASKPDTTALWRAIRRSLMVIIGSIITAVGYSLFQVPFNLAAGGISGLSIVLFPLTHIPVGTMFFILNLPLLVLGFYTLGRWRFLTYTLLSVVVFSVSADLLSVYLPSLIEAYPVTEDMLLSSIYAGIIVGLGNGMVYRAGGTMGGTNVIGRLIQRRTGLPLSQTYMYTDGIIIVLSGVMFGWEIALHGLLIVFVVGMASDFALEGPSVIRTVTIVTDEPEELTKALMVGLSKGASHWNITGSYTGQNRSMVMCTVYRSQVSDLRYIVAMTDPDAFMVIGDAHQAHGGGFLRLKADK
jgi:uncharacterized membrane-anchored protein YitT (DUF2179 family)